jgi:probable addiction module antidote protein
VKRASNRTAASAGQRARLRAMTVPFDVVDFLRTDEEIAAWLAVHFEEGSMDEILRALFDACRARGMGKVAQSAGLGRESLYKALAPKAHPRFETVLKLIRAFGLALDVKPATDGGDRRPTSRVSKRSAGRKLGSDRDAGRKGGTTRRRKSLTQAVKRTSSSSSRARSRGARG